jgi:glucose 1-dehydrogenase
MDTGLKGKTALITGGSSGIGMGIALVLAEEGVDLVIASRNPDPVVIKELKPKGIKCISVSADVSYEEQTVKMINQAISELGHLDIYINNAAWAWHQYITKISTDNWLNTLNTNLNSCMWASREVCKHMIARKKGNILIIGSVAMTIPSYKETAYRISKAGLFILMQQLAIEMAPYGIRVNMITPGHFKTRMTGHLSEEMENNMKSIIPLNRFGNVKDVGYAAVYLISDYLSGYTHGCNIVVDGGLSLRPLSFNTKDEIHKFNI